jgi:glycerol uptake facilitator-like aquaporin
MSRTLNASRHGGWEEDQRVGIRPDEHWATGGARVMTFKTYPWVQQLLLSPFHRSDAPDWGNRLLAFIMELVACIGLGLFVNLAKHAAVGGDALLNGAIIGLVYGGYFYMAWDWTRDYMLRRHMNWAVSLGYLSVGRCGVITFIVYAGVQFAGAAIAGAILAATPYGTVPDITAASVIPTALEAWGWEFFGSFLIVFTVLYNEMLENSTTGREQQGEGANKSDRRASEDLYEDEDENHSRVGTLVGIVIFLLVTVFFRNQVYSFGNVVYFAGLVGTGNAPANSDLVDGFNPSWAHYLGTPLAGAAAAILVYYLMYWAHRVIPDRHSYAPRRRYKSSNAAIGNGASRKQGAPRTNGKAKQRRVKVPFE